ncbi:HNH endonuclease [Paenibacillus agilis]|uniref:HNH endonuclease n=1 Tax=Paenibacillus agilis TaxID=3020863 RepID=A0A559IW66_9BACL|nr:HNH endonuclease signature motif containing protein [Paenibacillus agilis]TVX91831.1 HNH endonuclease [Paenibacillus agilis]
MGITSKTRKMLWGRSANRCAICRMNLVMDETETDDESVIGDECHIVAREKDGPRGDSVLTSEQRDKYTNLILLCKVHHKVIDDQSFSYSVQYLTELKEKHEEWVNKALDLDVVKQRDEEVYMTFIDKWSELCELENWKSWTSNIFFAGGYSLSIQMNDKLQEVKEYLFSRIWPERYLELNDSFENFTIILNDFFGVFHKHSERRGEYYYTERFYNVRDGDEEKYHGLLCEYNFHVDLLQDLLLELTRAVNHICDMVRRFLLPSYRINEGLLLIVSGPYKDLSMRVFRTQYKEKNRSTELYPGLDKFKEIRSTRDVCFGVGKDANDPEFLKNT